MEFLQRHSHLQITNSQCFYGGQELDLLFCSLCWYHCRMDFFIIEKWPILFMASSPCIKAWGLSRVGAISWLFFFVSHFSSFTLLGCLICISFFPIILLFVCSMINIKSDLCYAILAGTKFVFNFSPFNFLKICKTFNWFCSWMYSAGYI